MSRVSDTSFMIIASGVDSPNALYLASLKSHDSSVSAYRTSHKISSRLLKSALNIELPATTYSRPEHITVTGENVPKTYGFYYPPHNPEYVGPQGDLPPLIVVSHGGPTGHISPDLGLQTQYMTSRGYAVFCLNYRGSTGYGRAYIEELDGEWGVADVADAVNGVRFLGDRIDTTRVGIRGGSAGGYCVLQCLCEEQTKSTWAGGVSLYGISDMHALMEDTHKFESQ